MLEALRNRHGPKPGQDPFTLAPCRVHEAEGRGKRSFALFQAVRHAGAIVWVVPAHELQRPMLWGLPQGVAERLILATPASEADLLWSVEDALRTVPVGLVIAEPEKPMSLTEGRRLQLAAEAGQTTGLMLIRQDTGCNAAETRWNCEPVASAKAGSTWHHWALSKNKKGTLGSWTIDWNGATSAFHLAATTGQ